MQRPSRRLDSFGAALGVIALLTHCGGGDLTLPGPPETSPPAEIVIVTGDAQTGTPGTMLRYPIVVMVSDSAGAPLAAQRVEFAPDAPSAAVTPQAYTTGSDGIASARWVLGETAGQQEVVARVVGDGVPDELQARFTASAEAVLSSPRLTIRTEPSGSATIDREFSRQPEVQIQDEKGKDLKSSDVPVTVALASGPGLLSGIITRLTDSKGKAKFTNLKIQGATGDHVLIFAANGYTSVTSGAIEVKLPANQDPSVVDDEYNTTEGHDRTLIVGPATGVLANDQDPEGGALTASDASDPPDGTVILNGDGSFSYNPDVNFFGDDHFTYRATDPAGKSSRATVTIHVAPVNDAPGFTLNFNPVVVAAGQIPQTVANFAGGITPGAENESDQILTFEVVGNSYPWLFAAGPTVTRDGPGNTATLSFTPAAGMTGASAVTIVLRDNGGTEFVGYDTSAPQTFTIVVQ
ncbi:MAG: cadherin-like domain-containing protein [Gemmatimonadales bacterium]